MIAEDLRLVIRAEVGNAVANLEKVTKTIKETKTGGIKLQDTFAKFAKGMLAAGGIVFSINTLKNALVDCVREFQKQESAEAKLRAAIKATGKEYDISARGISKLASELQKTTVYADDVTISSAAMLQQLADLDEKSLKKLIPRVQNFASAMGVDLQTAATLVGKTLGSTTNALSRYGIHISDNSTGTQRLTELVGELDSKFAGMAESLGSTSLGRMEQFKNAIGDLKEVGGKLVMEFLAPAVAKMSEYLNQLNDSITKTRAYKDYVKGITDGSEAATDALGYATEQLNKYKSELQRVNLYLRDEAQMLAGTKDMMGRTVDEVFASYETHKMMKEEVIKLIGAWEAEVKALKGAVAEEKADEAAKEKKAKAIARYKQRIDDLRTSYQALVDYTYGIEVALRRPFEVAAESWQNISPGFGMTQMPETGESQMARRAQEIAQEVLNQKKLWDEQAEARRLAENAIFEGEQKEREEILKTVDVIRQKEAAYQQLQGYVNDTLSSIGTMWSNYYSGKMQGMDKESEEYKKLARDQATAEKAMAIFQATVNTAVAITQALKTGGALAPVLAVAAGIAGAAQIAAIASTPLPALAEGGIVTRPQYALMGEKGPEAVIPLNRLDMMGGVTVNVFGSVMEEEGLARKIGSVIARQRRGY